MNEDINLNQNEISLSSLMDLLDGISSLDNPRDAGLVLRDLLTYKELNMIARRIRVAELLKQKRGYRQISGLLGAGQDTVARIQRWMEVSGEGYDLLLDRISKARETRPSFDVHKYTNLERFMKRYALTFWPELALLELSKLPAKRRNKEMKQLMSELRRKAKIYRQIDHESKMNWRTRNSGS